MAERFLMSVPLDEYESGQSIKIDLYVEHLPRAVGICGEPKLNAKTNTWSVPVIIKPYNTIAGPPKIRKYEPDGAA